MHVLNFYTGEIRTQSGEYTYYKSVVLLFVQSDTLFVRRIHISDVSKESKLSA
jgi:hypothetical protein